MPDRQTLRGVGGAQRQTKEDGKPPGLSWRGVFRKVSVLRMPWGHRRLGEKRVKLRWLVAFPGYMVLSSSHSAGFISGDQDD